MFTYFEWFRHVIVTSLHILCRFSVIFWIQFFIHLPKYNNMRGFQIPLAQRPGLILDGEYDSSNWSTSLFCVNLERKGWKLMRVNYPNNGQKRERGKGEGGRESRKGRGERLSYIKDRGSLRTEILGKPLAGQICPEMQVNEVHAVYDKHHKVSSFLKSPKHT